MHTEILLRLLMAALWGGLVGIEREYRSKSAGFRTMIMISIGSCLFTILSMDIGINTNPDRIASNIVTGIGFLGAGVIYRGQNAVSGITTAATIWAVAAVGMGFGAGYFYIAGAVSVLILLVLAILPYAEEVIDRLNQSKQYSIQCAYSDQARQRYEQLLKQYHLKYKLIKQVKEGSDLLIMWYVQGNAKCHDEFVQVIIRDETVRRFEY